MAHRYGCVFPDRRASNAAGHPDHAGAGGGRRDHKYLDFAAFEPNPVLPTSGVFRTGLAAFTKLYADKYAVENNRMNNVLPGFIDSLPEKEEFRDQVPIGR